MTCCSHATDVENLPTLRVGLIIFPPFVQQNIGSECVGSTVDNINEIFPPSDYKVVMYCASPARIYRDLELNRIDLTINIKSTKSLSKFVEYSMEPHRILEVMLYSNTQMNSKTVSAINKFEYHGMRKRLASNGYTFIDYSNIKESLTVFLRGATTHLLSYRHPFDHYLKENMSQRAFKQLAVDFTEVSLTEVPTYYSVNKRTINAPEIVTRINAFHQQRDTK
ncbi:MAG: hypothetical protein WA981_10860 [Glaciecola sp.]